KRSSWPLLVVALSLSNSTPRNHAADTADDGVAHSIKLKGYCDIGKSTVITEVVKKEGSFSVFDDNGKLLREQRNTQVTEMVYTESVLENGERGPIRFKRSFEKAVIRIDDKGSVLPFQGRTVIYELKGNEYKLTAEGKPELTADELSVVSERP